MMSRNSNFTGQKIRRRLSGIVWLPLTLCLLGTGTESAVAQTATAQTATLVLTDDVIPGGNGTFFGFGPVQTLNANGEVAFIADLAGTQNPSTDGRGIYLANTQSVTKLVRTGESSPDGNGIFNHFAYDGNNNERVLLNDNGGVAFTATLTGTDGGSTDNVGLFGANVGSVTRFVRPTNAAPDGNGVFAKFPPEGASLPDGIDFGLSMLGLDNPGSASFHGFLTGTSGGVGVDDNGVFRSNGSIVTQLARAGEAVPGGDTTFEVVLPPIASNLNGQVAILAYMSFEPTEGPINPEGLERIYVSTGTVLEEVVRSDVPMPDGIGTVASFFQDLWIADNGNVVFMGNVIDTGDFLTDVPNLFLTDGETLTRIASQGQLAPGEQQVPGMVPFRFSNFVGIDSNNQDKVALSVTIERNELPPDNRSSGIYLGDGNGITLVVHQGDAVPGGNGTFGDVAVPVFLNNRGEIAFSAAVEGTEDPANDNRGIFFIDSKMAVHEVARAGKSLADSTILSAFFLGDFIKSSVLDNSDLNLAGMNGINDSGQVAFTAMLADGRSGIFLWQAAATPPDEEIFSNGFE
jgi:hypothetical protein